MIGPALFFARCNQVGVTAAPLDLDLSTEYDNLLSGSFTSGTQDVWPHPNGV